MNLVVVLLILLLLFGGGGFYVGGPMVGGSLGGLILLILIVMYHVPAAHTDGDSIVFFRHSDVVATGDIMRTDSYPVIDLQKGGNVQGVIDGLNMEWAHKNRRTCCVIIVSGLPSSQRAVRCSRSESS